jgi:hypothetical protein
MYFINSFFFLRYISTDLMIKIFICRVLLALCFILILINLCRDFFIPLYCLRIADYFRVILSECSWFGVSQILIYFD